MSYGSVYIKSDIDKLKKAKYSKRTIVNIIAHRIRYRYPNITIKDSIKTALAAYEGKEKYYWSSVKHRKENPPKISEREKNIWRKLNLSGI